jgi:hypothetical protein
VMNQNDTDRYYWRTGQRWSGDYGPLRSQRTRPKLVVRTILLLGVAFAVTTVMLFLPR